MSAYFWKLVSIAAFCLASTGNAALIEIPASAAVLDRPAALAGILISDSGAFSPAEVRTAFPGTAGFAFKPEHTATAARPVLALEGRLPIDAYGKRESVAMANPASGLRQDTIQEPELWTTILIVVGLIAYQLRRQLRAHAGAVRITTG